MDNLNEATVKPLAWLALAFEAACSVVADITRMANIGTVAPNAKTVRLTLTPADTKAELDEAKPGAPVGRGYKVLYGAVATGTDYNGRGLRQAASDGRPTVAIDAPQTADGEATTTVLERAFRAAFALMFPPELVTTAGKGPNAGHTRLAHRPPEAKALAAILFSGKALAPNVASALAVAAQRIGPPPVSIMSVRIAPKQEPKRVGYECKGTDHPVLYVAKEAAPPLCGACIRDFVAHSPEFSSLLNYTMSAKAITPKAEAKAETGATPKAARKARKAAPIETPAPIITTPEPEPARAAA